MKTFVMAKYRIRIARTQNIFVRNWTCPSGRLTAGSLSVSGFRAYRRLFFCSSRGIAHFPGASGRTISPPAPVTFARAASEAFATVIRIAMATRPEPNSLSIPAAVRFTLIRELSFVAWPAASNSPRRRARSSRSIACVSWNCAWRVNPCRPKCSGSYLIIHLRLCLCRPALPVPPRPPAPRPCFFPRPWVRLPRSFRVLLTIAGFLHEHPAEQIVDRFPPVTEVSAVVEPAFDPAESPSRRRQSKDRSQLPDLGQPSVSLREGLAQVPDRLVLAVVFDERVIDRTVSDLPAALEQEAGEHLGIDLAPRDVVFDELEHAPIRRVLRDHGAMILARQMEQAERVLHGVTEVALASESEDGEAHTSFASSVVSPCPVSVSVRSSPSTALSSGRGGASSTIGAVGATLWTYTETAPSLILSRSVCSPRT